MIESFIASRHFRFLAAVLVLVFVTALLGPWAPGNWRSSSMAEGALAAPVTIDASSRPSVSARAYLPAASAKLAEASSGRHSLAFNGSGAHVEVADAPDLKLAKQFTLEAWIVPAAVTSHRHIVGKNYYELSVDPYPGGWVASFEVRVGGTWYTARSGAYKLGEWYHVAGAFDGAELRVYVNGQPGGSTRVGGSVDQSSHPLRIGSADGADDFFNGAIDEVRVSSSARYTTAFARPGGPFSPDAATVGLWHFNEGAGESAADASAGAHIGTLLNNAQWLDYQPWQAGPTQPATPTDAPPTATAAPATTTPQPPTATSVPSTATSVPATATSVPATATSVPSTATSVPPTATRQPPTATSVPAPTNTAAPVATATPRPPTHGDEVSVLPVGSLGYSDVGTHQVVRTADDRVYIFAPEIYKNYVRALRAASTATPSGFAEADAAHRPTSRSSIWAVDAAVDGQNLVHLLYISEDGDVVYTTFDTAGDRWGNPQTIAAGKWPNRNNDLRQGSAGVSIALDAAGVAHVVYSKVEGTTRRVYYNSNAGGAWKNEQPVDQLAGNDNSHATLAFAPDGTLYVAWLSAPDGNRGALMVRALRDGSWGAQATVDDKVFANQGYSIDQGPSLLVGPDGTVHLVYIGPYEQVLSQPSRYEYGRVHHRLSSDGGRSWTADDPPLRYSHNPSLWIDAQGNLAIFGHREYWLGDRCASMLVTVHPAGGSWSQWRTFADGCFDASVSTRWAQFHRVAPDVLDAVYWTEKGPNGESDMNQLYYAEVRGGVETLLALAPADR